MPWVVAQGTQWPLRAGSSKDSPGLDAARHWGRFPRKTVARNTVFCQRRLHSRKGKGKNETVLAALLSLALRIRTKHPFLNQRPRQTQAPANLGVLGEGVSPLGGFTPSRAWVSAVCHWTALVAGARNPSVEQGGQAYD
jgi:hypothetical protein